MCVYICICIHTYIFTYTYKKQLYMYINMYVYIHMGGHLDESAPVHGPRARLVLGPRDGAGDVAILARRRGGALFRGAKNIRGKCRNAEMLVKADDSGTSTSTLTGSGTKNIALNDRSSDHWVVPAMPPSSLVAAGGLCRNSKNMRQNRRTSEKLAKADGAGKKSQLKQAQVQKMSTYTTGPRTTRWWRPCRHSRSSPRGGAATGRWSVRRATQKR